MTEKLMRALSSIGGDLLPAQWLDDSGENNKMPEYMMSAL